MGNGDEFNGKEREREPIRKERRGGRGSNLEEEENDIGE